jgi:hypothetical protein
LAEIVEKIARELSADSRVHKTFYEFPGIRSVEIWWDAEFPVPGESWDSDFGDQKSQLRRMIASDIASTKRELDKIYTGAYVELPWDESFTPADVRPARPGDTSIGVPTVRVSYGLKLEGMKRMSNWAYVGAIRVELRKMGFTGPVR